MFGVQKPPDSTASRTDALTLNFSMVENQDIFNGDFATWFQIIVLEPWLFHRFCLPIRNIHKCWLFVFRGTYLTVNFELPIPLSVSNVSHGMGRLFPVVYLRSSVSDVAWIYRKVCRCFLRFLAVWRATTMFISMPHLPVRKYSRKCFYRMAWHSRSPKVVIYYYNLL